MTTFGVMLFNSSMIAGSNISVVQAWPGGRSSVVISALAYPASPGLQLQIQAPSSSLGNSGGNWITVGTSFTGDQLFTFDAPKGNYRLVNQTTSSAINVNAALVTIPY